MIEPVYIKDKAIEEIKHIMATKNVPEEYGVRIGVKGGGGCGGFMNYSLGFDRTKDGDFAYEVAGVPVFVEKKQMMYLIGLELDFYEGADARGFTFIKPEAEGEEAL